MPLKPLDLTSVVKIIVNLSQRSAVRKGFNVCCLIGKTDIISAAERVREYTSLDEMLQDGFKLTDRLYKAAALLMGQNKKPDKFMVGCIATVKSVTETAVQALKACREANYEWYVGIVCEDQTATQHLANLEYTNSCTPDTVYAYTSGDAENDAAATDNSVFVKAKNKLYRRCFGLFSTKHSDAVAAAIGNAMAFMTGTINSAFTMKFKTLSGIETENATSVFPSNSVTKIKGANGNVYVNRGTYYNMLEEGVMADGSFFDEIIFLDKFKNDCQLAIMDRLTQNAKVPQTEAGMTILHRALEDVCQKYNKIGFLASGVWNGNDVLELTAGDTLPNGYLIQSEPIDKQSQSDRDNRIAPPIYIALKLAGAIHSVVVQVDVNR